MKIIREEKELTVQDFKMMLRAYLSIPDTAQIEVRIDGAVLEDTFENIWVLIKY